MTAIGLELEHALGFTPNIQGLVFHPAMNRSVVLYSCGRLLVETNLDDCHKQRILRGHDSIISCLDASPTGSMIASGQHVSVDGVCYFNIWDYESGSLRMRVATPHKGKLDVVRFSPDEMLVATTGAEGMLCIFDSTSGKCIASFQDSIQGDQAKAIRWGSVADSGTRYQRYSLCVPFSTGVRLFTLSFSIQKLSFELHCTACQVPGGGGRLGGYVRHFLCCTTLGQNILCGATSGDLMVFNSESGLYRAAISLSSNGVTAVSAFEERNCVFTGGGDGKVKKVSGADADWKLFGEVTLEGAVTSMASSADGSQVVISTTAGYIYRMLTDDMTYTIALESPLKGLNDVAVCPHNPAHFATASGDGYVRLWDLNDYSILSKFTLAQGPGKAIHQQQIADASALPTACAFELTRNLVLVGFSDGKVRCIDTSSKKGAVQWTTPGGHRGKVHTVRVCSQYFTTAGDDSVIRIWSRSTRELISQLQDHKLPTTSVHIDNTTSSILHSISMDMTHCAYDLSQLGKTAGVPRRVSAHNVSSTGGFLCCSQRSNGEHEMVVGTADGRILFFDLDVAQRPVLEVGEPSKFRVVSCECSPDGAYVAVGQSDGGLRVYRLGVATKNATKGNTCDLLIDAACHSGAVTRTTWTADSKQLISASSDGDLIVWNLFKS
jgi:cilia- and flagella-associated protein 52